MLWLRHPTAPPKTDRPRSIRGGPLIDLAAVQRMLEDSEADIEFVTRKAESDFSNLGWSVKVLERYFCALRQSDYRSSQWCQSQRGWLACDDYSMRFDDDRLCRSNEALPIYIKFSAMDVRRICIQIVSCHL